MNTNLLLYIPFLSLLIADYSLTGVLKFNNQTGKNGTAIIQETPHAVFQAYLFPNKTSSFNGIDGTISSIAWFTQPDYKHWKINVTRTFTKDSSDIAALTIYADGEYAWKSSSTATSIRSKAIPQ